MPIYEFHCDPCRYVVEEIRRMGDHSPIECSRCKGKMVYIVSVPAMQVWNAERKFPNLSPHGDGTMTFASKEDYKTHLKMNHVAELSHTAPVKTPHGAEVTVYSDATGNTQSPR